MHYRLKALPAGPTLWQAVRDQEVRKAEVEAAIDLRRLSEEQKLLDAEAEQIDGELTGCGHSASSVKAHGTLAQWWGGLFILASALAVVSTWWSVNWYLTLTWEKAALAVTLFVLPLVGWMAFLMRARDWMQERFLQRILCALGLLIVLSSATAGILLGLGRMAGVTVIEERSAATPVSSDLDAPSADAAPAPPVERISKVKSLLAVATAGAVILLILAGEVAAGIAFDEYVKRMTVVWTVAPLYRRRNEVAEELAANAEAEEAARRRPELVHAQLTIQGLKREEAALAEATEKERETALAAHEAEEHARRRDSVGYLVRRVVIAFLIGLAVILVIAAIAVAEDVRVETTVVVLDLSRSTEPAEFARNIRAVEGLIARTGAGGSLTVLGIGEASFAAAPLLRESAPLNPGRFAEHLDAWHRSRVAKWRRIASELGPVASGSDLFGALARAAEEFGGDANGRRRLVVLSDMRHVGRGINLERPFGPPKPLVDRVEAQALIPRLGGVGVWLLGVHSAGIDERHWGLLKAFWVEYLRRAGAELKAFSPNRQLGG